MRKLGFSRPSNLCPYFWKLVFSLMVPVVFLIAVAFILFALLLAIIWIIHHPDTFAFWAAFVIGIIAVFFGAGWLAFSAGGRMARAKVGGAPLFAGVAEGAHLTGDYIAAVHHKLCPVLEFVDDTPPARDLRVI
jgi:hypothetical protein